ncbi:hypothetical protein [Actinoallomurus acaciae]|uniref:Apolipoprotein N-acyltransferase n=1 Tax=Actinoallomurus acaciae TaxID=502577 RepID=A0ABV5YEZ0_9ACTN
MAAPGPLLIPSVVRWPATGAGGRLGRYGVLRAVCLGAACAAQQLPWFLAPFLIVGGYLVRRGETGHRSALAVVAPYTSIASLTWLLINAYFIIQDPKAWLSGLLLPLTQGAILHGQGATDIPYYLTAGSSRLDFYSYGSMLLELGLLAAFALFIKRLGPAATVLPWCAFYLATRSQDGYFLLMTPLWSAGHLGLWRIGSGPITVGPHASVWYVLLPPGKVYSVSVAEKPRIYLCAFTGTPMTISSVRLSPAHTTH